MTMREKFGRMIENKLGDTRSLLSIAACVAWAKENDASAKYDFTDDGFWLEIKFSDGSDVLLLVENEE